MAGLALFWPALSSPMGIDDHLHAAMLEGSYPGHRPAWDLYDFISDSSREGLRAIGSVPWWAREDISLHFLRPLPSLLISVEHALVGRAPLPLHAHSFVWWFLAVLAASALYRRTLPSRAAALATVVFALAPAHAMPLAWVADRSVLLCLVFGAAGLAKQIDWRRSGRSRDGLLALLAFTLSVLCGEYGLAFLGYVMASEVLDRGTSWRQRGARLLPAALPSAAFLAVWAALGCGAVGFGFYADLSEGLYPLLARAPARASALALHAWLGLGLGAIPRGVPTSSVGLGAAALVLVAIWPIRHALSRCDGRTRLAARAFLLGSILASAPYLATNASPRMVGAIVLGVAPIIALLMDAGWRALPQLGESHAAKGAVAAALVAGLVHLAFAPWNAWHLGAFCRDQWTDVASRSIELRREMDAREEGALLVLGGRSWWSLPFELTTEGDAPATIRVLTEGPHVLLTRRGSHSLEAVSPPSMAVVPAGEKSIITRRPLREGDVIEAGDFRVTILEAPDAIPRRVLFDFDATVDLDESLWVSEEGGLFRTTPRLPVGYSVAIDQ